MTDEPGSSSRRRRERHQNSDRLSAFEKLKKLKGSKHKYEVTEFENVYEEVDEKEYSKRVLERQDHDWIVDDDGSGYVEDGRDIFDDDLDDESIFQASRKKKRTGDHGTSKRIRKSDVSSQGKSNNIRSMLANMPAKKEVPVSLDEDELLNSIMQEMTGNENTETEKEQSESMEFESSEESATKYLKQFTDLKPKSVSQKLAKKFNSINKKVEKQYKEDTSNDDLCELAFQDDLPDDTEDIQVIEEIDKKESPKTNQIDAKNDLCATMFEDDFSDINEIIEDSKMPKDINKEPSLRDHKAKNAIQLHSQNSHISEVHEDFHENFNLSVPSSGPLTSEHVSVNLENLPLVTNTEGEKMMRFYWLTAHEEPFKQPGIIFLFGKVWIESSKSYVSCCVVVRNVERKVLLLPKEKMIGDDGVCKDVTFLDVYNEFSKMALKHGIMEFRSRKVEMHNCFTPNVPHTSEYMEVKYAAHCNKLPTDLKGNTFSHIYGTGTSALERFLLERRIKGPCWLNVHDAQTVNNCLSWCKVEVSVEKMEMISVAVSVEKNPPPPVILMALQIRSVLNPKNNNSEVALVVSLVNRDFPLSHDPPANKQFTQHFSILAPLSGHPYPYDLRKCVKQQERLMLEHMDSERALLNNLLAKIQRIDPDLIVGYDILGCDLEVLLQRLLFHKVANWSRIGRLRRHLPTPAEKRSMSFSKSFLCGRLPCDVLNAAKEHVQGVRSYDLETLCSQVLERTTHPAPSFEIIRQQYANGQSLIHLVKETLSDASNALQIMCQISAIPLALQITNIAGNVMFRTLIGGRAERNEFLLLHAFHEKNFIPPEKYGKMANMPSGEANESIRGKTRKKANYSGGLVLEPKKGLYEEMVVVMDFNSLYPSIIMEYNICFTTIPTNLSNDDEVIPDVPSKDLEIGILPAEIQKLVENRSIVKRLLQGTKLTILEQAQLHTRQLALKLMANSMYGCLGFLQGRFCAKPLAALVTAKGREILMKSKELVESMNYEVIYGDTDSIMINTNCSDMDEVYKIGKQVLQAVNKLYRCVNLGIDGIFRRTLLLKKKKYAVVEIARQPDGSIKTKIKHKGLDIVRRDWSRIAVECGNFVVEQILSDAPLEDRLVLIGEHLKKIGEDLRAGHVPLPLLTISKQLTKSIEQYADDKSQPHVLVAKRLLQKGICHLKPGVTVSYVICNDGTGSQPMQRAYHLDELKVDKNLKIDYQYYLSNQIHPVITRLLDPIVDADACRVAEFLGLDPAPYRKTIKEHVPDKDDIASPFDFFDITKSDILEKFSFICMNCKTEIIMDKPYKEDNGGNFYPILSRCSNVECSVPPTHYLPSIQNKLSFLLRYYVQQYYKGVVVCEDPLCPHKSTFMPFNFYRSFPVCVTCNSALMYKEVTDHNLYLQLVSFRRIFSINSSPDSKNIKLVSEVETSYSMLADQVTKFLKHSAYSVISLEILFEGCRNYCECNKIAPSGHEYQKGCLKIKQRKQYDHFHF